MINDKWSIDPINDPIKILYTNQAKSVLMLLRGECHNNASLLIQIKIQQKILINI
jgi:hypothetical protein